MNDRVNYYRTNITIKPTELSDSGIYECYGYTEDNTRFYAHSELIVGS